MYALPYKMVHLVGLLDGASAPLRCMPVWGFNLADCSTLKEFAYDYMIIHLCEDLGELMLENNYISDTGVY